MNIADLAFEALEMTYPNYTSQIYFAIALGAPWPRVQTFESKEVSQFHCESRSYSVRRASLEDFAIIIGEFPDSHRMQLAPACAVLAGFGFDFESLEAEILRVIIDWLKCDNGYEGFSVLMESLKTRSSSELLLFFGREGVEGVEMWSGFVGRQRA